MIKLLRGDDAKHLISLELPEVAFSEGMTVIFEIGGLKVTAPAAPAIEVQFPSTWTALQPCGRILGSWKIRDRNGNIGTLTKTFPVYLTDDVGEITSGSIVSGTVKPVVDFSDIAELTTSATPGDVKEAINEILRRLKSGLNCLLIAFAIPAFSAELTPDTIMDNVPGYATISNVVAAAGVAVGGGTDGEAVTNIAENVIKRDVPLMLNSKRDHTDLTYTHRLKRTGAAYVMVIYDAKTQERLETVAMPLFEERLDVGIYTQRNYQTIINGKTYFLSVTFGFSQDWRIIIMNDGKIEVNYSWTRVNDGKQTPSLEENDGKYIYVLYYDTRANIIEEVPDTLALVSDIPTTTKIKETAIKAIRESNGGVWDAKLEVWWTPKMENGKLTYQATTNVNIQAEN